MAISRWLMVSPVFYRKENAWPLPADHQDSRDSDRHFSWSRPSPSRHLCPGPSQTASQESFSPQSHVEQVGIPGGF